MADDLDDIAELLGATVVGQVPDVGGGALAAAYLAKVYQARMRHIGGQRAGEPAAQATDRSLEVPVSESVIHALTELAELVRTRTGRVVTPAEVATGLLGGAALHWAEAFRRLRDRVEQARARCAEATENVAEAERALRAALEEMSGVSDRPLAG